MHPLDPVVQALSGVKPEASRAQHIVGLCRQIKNAWPNLSLTPKAVEKWFEGHLPNKWRVLLTWLSQLKSVPITLPEPDVIKEPTA